MSFKPKTRYAQEKVKGLDFSNISHTGYIDSLKTLERSILEKPTSFPMHQLFQATRQRYPRDYLEILKELKPDEYKKSLNEPLEKSKKVSELEERLYRCRSIDSRIRIESELEYYRRYEIWWREAGGIVR